MNTRTLCAAAGITAALALLSGCYYTGNPAEGLAGASITIKQPAASISSVALIVTAPDLSPITASYPGSTETIGVEVPAGSARTFTVLVNTVSATFRGAQTVDLAAGEQKSLSLSMALDTTQIIVPDSNNGRLVQISDMNGTGWKEIKKATFLTALGLADFVPSDVDVDSWGRLYVGSYVAYSADSGAFQVDDIGDTTPVRVANASAGLGAVAVDRVNHYLYYSEDVSFSGSMLHRRKISASGLGPVEDLDPKQESAIGLSSYLSGLAVDENGILYLARHSLGSGTAAVFRYNPALATGSRVLAQYNNATNLGSPGPDGLDVWYSRGYVYVLSAGAPDGKKIQKLDRNLTFVKGYGSAGDFNPPETGAFYGPSRFLAIPGRKLHIIDYGPGPLENTVTRLVELDDALTGSDWTTYGSTGSGVDQFSESFYFYAGC